MITPADRIRSVAHRLCVVAPLDGDMGARLRGFATELNESLKALGHTDAESVIEGAQRALGEVGLQGVDLMLLARVLHNHPSIEATATEWDWSDTEVRDMLCRYLYCDLLKISEFEFLQALDDDEQALTARFWAAHEQQPWLQEGWKP